MRLSDRSYPHPVLGNKDDVIGAAFQATFDFSSDPTNYYISVATVCSSSTLNKLIANGTAGYVLHVECSNTLYRRVFDFTTPAHRIQIPADQLNDAVQVNVMIRARKDLPGYKIDKAHPDYGNIKFDMKGSDILAVAEGETFYADTSQDSLRKIGSIMQIEEWPEDGDHPMKVDFASNKIRIFLCKEDFKRYKTLKHIEKLASHLTTTIVLPVLLEALYHMEEENSGLESLGWYVNLQKRIDILDLEKESDQIAKAQRLLDLPIRRALAAAEQYGAVASD
jgi:hypothetical protein